MSDFKFLHFCNIINFEVDGKLHRRHRSEHAETQKLSHYHYYEVWLVSPDAKQQLPNKVH